MAYLGIDPSLRAFKQSMFKATGGETILPIKVDVETILVKNGSLLVPDADFYINQTNNIVVNTPATAGDEYFVMNLSTFTFDGMASKQDIKDVERRCARPLFEVSWWQNRSTIPDGLIPADGQLLTRATYPDAFTMIQSNKLPVVSDADWIADPYKRASYTAGNGSINFRVPDFNGKSVGAVGALVLRGDGKNSADAGVVQGDAIKSHSHKTFGGDKVYNKNTPAGSNWIGDSQFFPIVGSGFNTPTPLGAASSLSGTGSVDTGSFGFEENRMINTAGCWCIRLFNGVVNTGVANFGSAVTEIAKLQSDVQLLNDKIEMNRWYTGSSPQFKARFVGESGWYFAEAGECLFKETEHEIHLSAIIRRTASVSPDVNLFSIKNPNRDQLTCTYTPVESSNPRVGSTSAPFPQYIERFNHNLEKITVPIGAMSPQITSYAWIMINMTIAKNAGE